MLSVAHNSSTGRNEIINKNYIGHGERKNENIEKKHTENVSECVCARYFVQRKFETKKAWHFK